LQPHEKNAKAIAFLTHQSNIPHLYLMFNLLIHFSKIFFGIMNYLFTSESVSEGHPDKVSDQISDALLDQFLAFDADSKVAIETLVTTGQVVVAGEVKSKTYVDVQEVARSVINKIGYTEADYRFDGDSCGVLTAIHEQSADINRGVEKVDKASQGAGDQGMMFGYACKDTDHFMPLTLELSHLILQELAEIRRERETMTYLRPDAKSQVTVEYAEDNTPVKIHTIVVSTQHDEFDEDEAMLAKIKEDVINILIPKVKAKLPERVQALFGNDIKYHVNPTGKFVIGGPHGDTGLTGRKIIVDTYGGRGGHGGGAFSGKDPSKVDRSAAYASRHIAKNLVAAGIADEILVQLAYAIGVAEPVGVYVNTYGRSNIELSDGEIAEKVKTIFDLRPAAIEDRLKLRNPIYLETAAYGHMGRTPVKVTKRFESPYWEPMEKEFELFTWEKLDFIEAIKETFGI
jgi:S-adenosylmethionine synthetase